MKNTTGENQQGACGVGVPLAAKPAVDEFWKFLPHDWRMAFSYSAKWIRGDWEGLLRIPKLTAVSSVWKPLSCSNGEARTGPEVPEANRNLGRVYNPIYTFAPF
jgi:hypothetical protein